jgi:hypothetical protein
MLCGISILKWGKGDLLLHIVIELLKDWRIIIKALLERSALLNYYT